MQFHSNASPRAWLQQSWGSLLLENPVGSYPSSPSFSASKGKQSIVLVQRRPEGHRRCSTLTPACTCFVCPNGTFHRTGDYPTQRNTNDPDLAGLGSGQWKPRGSQLNALLPQCFRASLWDAHAFAWPVTLPLAPLTSFQHREEHLFLMANGFVIINQYLIK